MAVRSRPSRPGTGDGLRPELPRLPAGAKITDRSRRIREGPVFARAAAAMENQQKPFPDVKEDAPSSAPPAG